MFQVLVDDLLIGVAATEEEAEAIFVAWVDRRRQEQEDKAFKDCVATLDPLRKELGDTEVQARLDEAQNTFHDKMVDQVARWIVQRRLVRLD